MMFYNLLKTSLFLGIFCFVFGSITPVQADQVTLTSAKGWPNGRTSDEVPARAIDGDTSTFTWTTASFTTSIPAYLGVSFDAAGVGRIRLWKDNDGGGGENIKDLVIEYTNDNESIPLDSRTWQPVSGLTNGFGGIELFNATAVNTNGTVVGDIHDSVNTADGWGSLSFTPVNATGIRIAFHNPSNSGFEHYRVGEFEVYTAVPEPNSFALIALGLVCTGLFTRRRLRCYSR